MNPSHKVSKDVVTEWGVGLLLWGGAAFVLYKFLSAPRAVSGCNTCTPPSW